MTSEGSLNLIDSRLNARMKINLAVSQASASYGKRLLRFYHGLRLLEIHFNVFLGMVFFLKTSTILEGIRGAFSLFFTRMSVTRSLLP